MRINERRWLFVRLLLALFLFGLWAVLERGPYLIVGTVLIVAFLIFAPRIFQWDDEGDMANPS